jgi:hypothetical protein
MISATTMDYKQFSPDALLYAVERAGPELDSDLISECLRRRSELTGGLLHLLDSRLDDRWDEMDPRWYRRMHAGQLLIEFREVAALPVFSRILGGDPDAEPYDGFQDRLPLYGPSIVPFLIHVARNGRAPMEQRINAVEVLTRVARLHPGEHLRVAECLRSLLPALGDEGTLQLPAAPEDLDEGHVELYSWVAANLLDLRDTQSRQQVVALYMEDLIDESVVGDVNEYVAQLATPPEAVPPPPDIIEYYATDEPEADVDLASVARDMLLTAGMDEEVAEQLIEDVMDNAGASGRFSVGMAIHELRNVLHSEGVAESRMDGVVARVLRALDPVLGEDLTEIVDDLEAQQRHTDASPYRSFSKVGRNAPCPCGSGRKFKQCCGMN